MNFAKKRYEESKARALPGGPCLWVRDHYTALDPMTWCVKLSPDLLGKAGEGDVVQALNSAGDITYVTLEFEIESSPGVWTVEKR